MLFEIVNLITQRIQKKIIFKNKKHLIKLMDIVKIAL